MVAKEDEEKKEKEKDEEEEEEDEEDEMRLTKSSNPHLTGGEQKKSLCPFQGYSMPKVRGPQKLKSRHPKFKTKNPETLNPKP